MTSVLMLAQFYPPTVGGEEQHVASLAQELVRRGHAVTVATLAQPGVPQRELQGGVHVERLTGSIQRLAWLHRDRERPHAPPLPDPELVLRMRDLVLRRRPQIVHGHNWLVHSFLPLKSWARTPLVLTLHDYSLNCAQKRLMRKNHPCSGPGLARCLACTAEHYGRIKGVVTAAGTWAMGGAEARLVDMFLPVSQAVAEGSGLLNSGLPYQVIPNWAAESWDQEGIVSGVDGGTGERARADLPGGLPAGLPDEFLLFVGDMTYDKGLIALLEAYTLAGGRESLPPLVLIGRRRPETPKELPAGVIELGTLPHSQVMAAWRRCTAALVPSRWAEPFGMVALEAMSAGRPVIASASGGLVDIVVDGQTGILTPPGDVPALAQAMRYLVATPPVAEAMGKAGRERLSEFRAAKVVGRIEQVYERLLEQQVREPHTLVGTKVIDAGSK